MRLVIQFACQVFGVLSGVRLGYLTLDLPLVDLHIFSDKLLMLGLFRMSDGYALKELCFFDLAALLQ